MFDDVTGSAAFGEEGQPSRAALDTPLWRAAPTWLAAPGGPVARSRRWLIVGGIVVAGLLAGASVALASTESGPPAPVHAVRASTPTASAAPSSGSGREAPAAG
jgi:hypothetical protein